MRTLSALLLALFATLAIATPAAQAEPVISDDDPAWVCWTMGNRLCSSVPLDGPGAP